MYLLDTNVVSELRKAGAGRADPHVVAWADSVAAVDLSLSAVTILELEIGTLRLARRDTVQASHLRRWLDEHVLPAFRDRILPVDVTIAQRTASLQVPDPRADRDCIIAATALVHGLVVVTRNVADFEGTGARLLNPWLPRPPL